MANLTVRNIPEDLLALLKNYAAIERRSLNNELLIALELGVRELRAKVNRGEIKVPPDVQVAIWKELAGKWKDTRTTAEIIKDIIGSRTMGRDDIRL